ncbi:MAG TPA: flagellar basal body L-ring protein FlgH [Terriglobales bacterium]|nr:flagellar basal body L-ring protein FlgH [Terriglobales bacterium]
MRYRLLIFALALEFLLSASLAAKDKQKHVQGESRQQYVQRMQQQVPDLRPSSPGSLWTDNGTLVHFFSDYKAARVGDPITIVVNQSLSAQSAGSVSTARTLNASSGITALGGQLKTTGVQSLFSPNSSQTLAGKSQAATTSTLQTSLSGIVVAVLPSGVLVVEAEREMTMNNERQTVLVRGLVRPGDIAPDGSISSNLVANLELELKGKGVLSDGVRPPNPLVRWILRIVGF